MTAGRRRVVVVGGGLAGLAAALEAADRGAAVTLIERQARLGGLTWSFDHHGLSVDNGQHVFLRCCTDYLRFLDRIGAGGDVILQPRLDIPVVAPGPTATSGPRVGRLRRTALPAPFHLLGSLLRYPHLPPVDRVRLGRAVAGLYRLRLGDPALDRITFGEFLAARGQSPAAVAAVWDLITVPTVNLPAAEASLAMAAKVFKTGLLGSRGAADVGWSRVPLGQLHGQRAGAALAQAGVEVRTLCRVAKVRRQHGGSAYTIDTDTGPMDADAVVVAVPHEEAGSILPSNSLSRQDELHGLGASAVIDIHLVFDRAVTDWPVMAGLGSPVQWVFDRTSASGLDRGRQYLAVSMSAADEHLGRRPADLIELITGELARLLVRSRSARVVDALVTKERRATFAARPGTAALRPQAQTAWPGLAVAGAWTDSGWPATMEGAVRSGAAAAGAAIATVGRPTQVAAGAAPSLLATTRTPLEVA